MKNGYKKLYGVFRKNRETGIVEGYVEHGICMGWSSKRVRAWRELKHAEHHLKYQVGHGDTKKYHYFVRRLNTQKTPSQFAQTFTGCRRTSFDYRNVFFSVDNWNINGKLEK